MIVPKDSDYPHSTHLHRYACWAAARAAQRRFSGGTTAKVIQILESCGFQESVAELHDSQPSRHAYDEWHFATVMQLQDAFKQQGIVATHGQVAKIIAIYLKTVYVIRFPDSALAHVAHPPIDRILLMNVRNSKETKSFSGSINWTQFDRASYQEAVEYLRSETEGRPFWEIEKFWDPRL